jgi:glutathione S-transferase
MFELYIGNKNYSSWSLRPWVLMRELGIPFKERLLRFGDSAAWAAYRESVQGGTVPALVDGPLVVWDSLAIVEYLAERDARVWPQNPVARAWGRSASAQMHAGFGELRARCPMNCGLRVRLRERPPELLRDLANLSRLWSEGLGRFGGPFLAGAAFSAVDAFFAPVAFRIQTYDLDLAPEANAYAARLLGLGAMRAWYADGIAETFRDEAHEREFPLIGDVERDVRAISDGR